MRILVPAALFLFLLSCSDRNGNGPLPRVQMPANDQLVLVSPLRDTVILRGSVYNSYYLPITWHSSRKYGVVNIALYKNGVFHQPLAVAPDDSVYYWLTNSTPADSHYAIGIHFPDLPDRVLMSGRVALCDTAQGLTADAAEPDSTPALAPVIAVGAWLARTLLPNDADWFAFDALRDSVYTLETTGFLDTYLELYQTDGTSLLSYNDDGGESTNARIIFPCTADGRYYALAHSYIPGVAGSYSFRIQSGALPLSKAAVSEKHP